MDCQGPEVCIQAASSRPCSPRAVVDRHSRTSEVLGGHLRQRASTAQDSVAAGETAELPDLIEWSGTGSNCRPSAFSGEFDRRGEVLASGPGCCAVVIYLHTAVHRLWLTRQALRRCLRSPMCLHQRTAARLARAGKSQHAYRPHRGRKQRPAIACSGMHTTDRHAVRLSAVIQ